MYYPSRATVTALNLSSDDNSDLSALGVRVNEVSAVPIRPEVQSYLGSLADSYGLPQEVVPAVAQTQSGFATDTVRANRPASDVAQLGADSQRYGVMQVSDDQIGKAVRDADGAPYQIGDNIMTDWRANADAGVALLAQHYRVAEMEQPYSTLEERAQQAYSGYSAGNANRDRYLITLPYSNAPAHPDDREFLQNLRNAADSVDDSSQAPQKSKDSTPTQQPNAPSQPGTPPPPAQRSADRSTATPLPPAVERLKENPGDTFVQTPPELLRPPAPFAPSRNAGTPSGPSFLNLTPFFAAQKGTGQSQNEPQGPSVSAPADLPSRPRWLDAIGQNLDQSLGLLGARQQPQPPITPTGLSNQGLQFIARHEAKPDGTPALAVYSDIYGNPTIGYGHVVKPGEDFSTGITEKQAMDILLQDTKAAQSFVSQHVTGQLTQSQFDALTSVAFNSPRAAVKLAEQLNNSKTIDADDFINSLRDPAHSPRGLINRRNDESRLYLRSDYGNPQK